MLRLDIDTDRDGRINEDEPGRWDWGWGPDKPGAIVAVDCDQDSSDGAGRADHAPINLMIDESTAALGDRVFISIDPASAPYVVLWSDDEGGGVQIAGALDSGAIQQSAAVSAKSATLRLQALSFPTASFDGLVEIVAVLITADGRAVQERGGLVRDRALFRVAPWIMPTTLARPEEVYIVDQGKINAQMKAGLRAVCNSLHIAFTVLSVDQSGGDVWIQDEIEIGYTQTPTATTSVVLDGPRDRELDGLADRHLKRDGTGVWNVHAHLFNSSLDSFGNLEVSPPVTVGGTDYPLGRIIHGSKKQIGIAGEKSSLALRQFLYAQKVQAPVEVFTDWLLVGHIDEIVSFVPFDNERGFRVLVASTSLFRTKLESLDKAGQGDLRLWKGLKRNSGEEAERSIAQLLGTGSDIDWAFNAQCDANTRRVRDVLVEQLALKEEDFAEIPSAFANVQGGYALAYFPGMVNHLVLGEASVVPDPYGPLVDGVDLLQQAFRDALGSRGPAAVFVDDWLGYHEKAGEVHCGTNVRRAPDGVTPWWELNLPGLWDASAQVR